MQYLKRTIGILVALAPFVVVTLFSSIEWRPFLGKASDTGYFLLAFGGLFCVANLYCSYLRYPLFRLFGGNKEEYKWVSGFPFLGILALIGFMFIPQSVWISVIILFLLLIDTGSVSWFVVCTWKDDSLWK
jgi:hypothetical protein